MINIFYKFKKFWRIFFDSIKDAYNKVYKDFVNSSVQEWRDILKINLLNVFVSKLNNLTNTEATFTVESDSTQTEYLKKLCEKLQKKRFEITSSMLADGDFYVFPAHNDRGELIHTYLTQQQVRILSMEGEEIREAEGIIDWYVDKKNQVFYLLRNHKLDNNGTLTISYSVKNEYGKETTLEQWEHLNGVVYAFKNSNHIGFGRYKSPVSSRGLSPIYGVPLNFGCSEIEDKIFKDLKLIDEEFKNGRSKIFADITLLRTKKKNKEEKAEYDIPESVFPVNARFGDNNTKNIDIFNPKLRYSEHYSKLVADFSIYEKTVGTSKGILTDNETSYTATATAVKRANADTLSLIDNIRTAIDEGNEMTLLADSAFLNISPDLWSYKSDWYDPFEDPDVQWNQLKDGVSMSIRSRAEARAWQTGETLEDAQKKIEEIDKTEPSLKKMLGMSE